jgi:transcriptional regulator with XRE-family HTH domain
MIKWLVEARKKKGLSQEQVAAKLGVPRTRITKIESFDRRLDLLETLQLTRLYGLHLDDIEAMMK